MSSPPPYAVPGHVPEANASFVFAAITTAFLRVHLNSSGQAVISGATQKSIGVNWMNNVETALESGTVRRNHMVGETVMVAAGAIAVGAPVFAAASGKVAATGTVLEGIAKSVATADGNLIVVVPVGAIDTTGAFVSEYSTSVVVSAAQAAANSGNGQVDITLPFTYAASVPIVQLLTVTTGRIKSTYDVTGTASTLSIKGVAAGTQVDEGDIVNVHVKRIS
jgi:hypothetical protein